MILFEPTLLGKLKIKNKIVMAPLTRSRAIGNLPNDLMAKYYSQRAGAGLIITEGTSPSPNGLGYARIPGLFSYEQMLGWKQVTTAVHQAGGAIFVQLMHTGRISHPLNMPAGARVLAPSAIAAKGKMFTDQSGQLDQPVPEEMSLTDIEQAIGEYVHASELAMQAGFDGVELHGANGYLIEQFLNPHSNKRTDEYGGTAERRMRFALEIAKGVAEKIGGDRLGIRVSPYGANGDVGAFEGIDQFYGEFAQKLSALKLAYIHIVDHSSMGAPPVSPAVKKQIRENFKGKVILSGGYNAEKAEVDLKEGKGDLIAFGRPFISNPTLVEKMKSHAPLTPPDATKFYTPGPEGYTTYA